MKARILKDKKKRKLFCKHEQKRLVFKSIVRDEKLPDMVRWKASLKLTRLPKNSSKVRIRNRCVITGRPRGVSRHSRISRIALRDLASMGLMNGISKSSW
jgi:small subunit ribosomal protein S14